MASRKRHSMSFKTSNSHPISYILTFTRFAAQPKWKNSGNTPAKVMTIGAVQKARSRLTMCTKMPLIHSSLHPVYRTK
jgi:hypothetical protein